MSVKPLHDDFGAFLAQAGDGSPPVRAASLDVVFQVAERWGIELGDGSCRAWTKPLTAKVGSFGRGGLGIRCIDKDGQDSRGDGSTCSGFGECISKPRVGHDGSLDQVVAHGGEVLLKALADLRSIIRVIQLGNAVDGDALDPCAKRSEVATGVAWCAQDDVGVLGHELLLFGEVSGPKKYKVE